MSGVALSAVTPALNTWVKIDANFVKQLSKGLIRNVAKARKNLLLGFTFSTQYVHTWP